MTIKVKKEELTKSHTPIFDYCRKLIEKGVSPQEDLEVYGPSLADETKEILHFKVNVGNGATLTVKENENGTPKFRKYKGVRGVHSPAD